MLNYGKGIGLNAIRRCLLPVVYGKEKLWELVDNSNSEELVYANICKVFGVKREKIGKLIKELL